VPPPPVVDPAPSAFDALVHALTPLLPIPALLLILPAIYLFFRSTWRELDEEAHRHRGALLAEGKTDLRPFVALAMCAVILCMQEYFGGRIFFEATVKPHLFAFEVKHPNALRLVKYDELYGFGWWALTRCGGYLMPFVLWKAFFPKDSLLDMGLRAKGFLSHAWIYLLFLTFVLPAMLVVSRQPDFGSYYPFYKLASRSWLDFGLWEMMYFAQFFSLEMFFRGFWLGALRKSFGSGAIFAMAVPYCMIHFGKPYLEAMGAIVAGIALGSISMMTRSIYQGFMVHITVAALMDWLSLYHRHGLPKIWVAPN
jgi:membrane protease YdiL (CAAX protease family)